MQGNVTGAFGVNVIGFVSARLGLGVAARASIEALVTSGVSVSVVDLQLPDGRSGSDTTWAHLQVGSIDSMPHAINLVHVNPPEAAGVWTRYPQIFSGRRNYAVPFFELPDLPAAWYPHLARYDALLAPSEHISGAIRNVLALPVRHYPISVDVKSAETLTRAELGIPEEAFAFAATLDTDSGLNRKNGIGMLRAFANAFAHRRGAVLVLKVNGLARHPELDREIAMMPAGMVRVIDQYMPYPKVLGLYAACDAFLSLHRAEGLGLGPLEAMLLGKPVVATGWSGTMDFMSDDCAALVRFTFTPVLDTQGAYAPGEFSRPQYWAEPDLLHASELMRKIADDQPYRTSLAQAGRDRAQQRRDRFFRGGAAQIVQGLSR